jgi:hypothetical protein
LPFSPSPTASKAGPTLQESVHNRRVEPDCLSIGAPNVLIVLNDAAGFSVPDTFGGFAHTPTLSRLRNLRSGGALRFDFGLQSRDVGLV